MSDGFFSEVAGPIPFGGLDSTDPLSFKVYEPDRLVLGKRMEDHLRIAVCLWHSFNWPGSDVFGVGTFDRPWLDPRLDPMIAARAKLDAAFEFLAKLGVPYFCFHDRDIAPEGATFAETQANLDAMIDEAAGAHGPDRAGSSCGAPPTCSAIRATRPARRRTPTPRCSPTPPPRSRRCSRRPSGSTARTTSCGAGGRATRPCSTPTSPARRRQLARFLAMVAEHKHRIGFKGTLLIEPKPQEPTKHQYDYDGASILGFLERHDLDKEYRLNLEVNHATLAGHSFHHEVAYAIAHGVFGSVDANRGDYQNGWDTDQFPNSVDELSLAVYEIVRAGGFTTGGFNFDTKLRRQSMDRTDLFHAHIGGIDTLARSLLVAAGDDRATGRSSACARSATRAGAGDLGRSILSRQGSARGARRPRRDRRDRPAARRRAARSCSRTSSTRRSGPPTGRPGRSRSMRRLRVPLRRDLARPARRSAAG